MSSRVQAAILCETPPNVKICLYEDDNQATIVCSFANTPELRTEKFLYCCEVCPICLHQLRRSSTRSVTPCHHVFCSECLENVAKSTGFQLLLKSPIKIINSPLYICPCPLCRTQFVLFSPNFGDIDGFAQKQ